VADGVAGSSTDLLDAVVRPGAVVKNTSPTRDLAIAVQGKRSPGSPSRLRACRCRACASRGGLGAPRGELLWRIAACVPDLGLLIGAKAGARRA